MESAWEEIECDFINHPWWNKKSRPSGGKDTSRSEISHGEGTPIEGGRQHGKYSNIEPFRQNKATNKKGKCRPKQVTFAESYESGRRAKLLVTMKSLVDRHRRLGVLILTMIHFFTIDSQYELHENSENYGATDNLSLIFPLYSLDFFKVKQKMGGVGKGFRWQRLFNACGFAHPVQLGCRRTPNTGAKPQARDFAKKFTNYVDVIFPVFKITPSQAG